MSSLTPEQVARVEEICRRLRWGETTAKSIGVTEGDVKALVSRITDLELDVYSSADDMVKFALDRMVEERKRQSAWLEDAIEQVRIAELLVVETDQAIIALKALADGGLNIHGGEIIERWDAVEESMRKRGLLPPRATPDPPPAEPEPEAPPPAEPPPPVADASEPPTDPEPPQIDDIGARIMADLDALATAHGQDLNAMRVAEHLGEPHERVRVSLYALEKAGHLQMVKRPDKNMYAILRPGEVLENDSGLSDNQLKLFNALASVAGADWSAQISRGRLKEMTGINVGSIDQVLWALEKKDRIRIIERGDSKTPATFLICDAWRPERAAPPKTDEELIAEALAAGKVTECPPVMP